MQANIKGLVDRLELSQGKAMMPLYEAISNAVDAIEEHQDGFINHSIRIRLVVSNDLTHQGGDGALVVDGFDVIGDEGYFKTLTGGNGYVEIISYDKLLKDAARRNRVLFEKLGLQKN